MRGDQGAAARAIESLGTLRRLLSVLPACCLAHAGRHRGPRSLAFEGCSIVWARLTTTTTTTCNLD